MHPTDIAAAAVFALCWIAYEPVLARLARSRGALNLDMAPVREAWIRRMLAREVRIMDTNLLGHLTNSASFFASTNLLVIAAAAGVLFGGEAMLARLGELAIAAPAPAWLMEVKIALVMVVLARGLLDFIWAIRQLNYCLALLGAAPEHDATGDREGFVKAFAGVLSPSFESFNRGVRAYYFALVAGAWIVSPWAFAGGAVAVFLLLLRRQTSSGAAQGVRAARKILETEAAPPPKN